MEVAVPTSSDQRTIFDGASFLVIVAGVVIAACLAVAI